MGRSEGGGLVDMQRGRFSPAVTGFRIAAGVGRNSQVLAAYTERHTLKVDAGAIRIIYLHNKVGLLVRLCSNLQQVKGHSTYRMRNKAGQYADIQKN